MAESQASNHKVGFWQSVPILRLSGSCSPQSPIAYKRSPYHLREFKNFKNSISYYKPQHHRVYVRNKGSRKEAPKKYGFSQLSVFPRMREKIPCQVITEGHNCLSQPPNPPASPVWLRPFWRHCFSSTLRRGPSYTGPQESTCT
jgi:hypothetical protein